MFPLGNANHLAVACGAARRGGAGPGPAPREPRILRMLRLPGLKKDANEDALCFLETRTTST